MATATVTTLTRRRGITYEVWRTDPVTNTYGNVLTRTTQAIALSIQRRLRQIDRTHHNGAMWRYAGLMGCLDYFSIHTEIPFTGNIHWIAPYVVRGGSEGYYLHVDLIYADGNRTMPFLLKTLDEGQESRDRMWHIAQLIAEWMQ
jgi:hypothetical protein